MPTRPRAHVALVGPTPAAALRFQPRVERRSRCRLVPLSLSRFLSDRNAPARIVLCPAGGSLADDLAFLESARRRALWPAPGIDLWGAIAGLRGSHEEVPESAPRPASGSSRRTSALFLEGDVTRASARRAAASGAPRHWIVERVQRVRIPEFDLEELRLLGIRWSVLEPVEVVALVATDALAAARPKWARWLPEGLPVWRFARSKFKVQGSK